MILFNCYSIVKNECDIRCQSCGLCPICDDFHSGEGKPITRWVMFKYWLSIVIDELSFYKKYRLRKAVKEFLKSEEGRRAVEGLAFAIKNKGKNK